MPETHPPELNIRPAMDADAGLILQLIRALAIYEKAEHEVLSSEADIQRHILSADSVASALIIEHAGQPVGFAVYFFNYSTWLGKPGLFLEDLFVLPEARGLGAGKALLIHLAKLAVAKDCGRFEWNVLKWNQPAIDFYQSLGAAAQDEWVGYRIDGERLQALAQRG